jgi:hypothetical protein
VGKADGSELELPEAIHLHHSVPSQLWLPFVLYTTRFPNPNDSIRKGKKDIHGLSPYRLTQPASLYPFYRILISPAFRIMMDWGFPCDRYGKWI